MKLQLKWKWNYCMKVLQQMTCVWDGILKEVDSNGYDEMEETDFWMSYLLCSLVKEVGGVEMEK